MRYVILATLAAVLVIHVDHVVRPGAGLAQASVSAPSTTVDAD